MIIQQNYHKTIPNFRSKSFSLHKIGINSKQSKQSINRLTKYLETYQNRKQQQINKNIIDNDLQDQPILKNIKKIFSDDYQNKCLILLENICLNFQIFQKVFKNSRRKKTIMSKLYGWDQQFGSVFFNGQDIIQKLIVKSLYKQLGLDKRTLKAKNMYNKLRLFLQELIVYNRRQQQLQCQFQRERLSQSIHKLKKQMISLKQNQNKDSKQYQQLMRKTQNDIINKKKRIKNKRQSILSVDQKTGKIKVNQFFIHEQKNIDFIESLLRNKMY